MPARPPVGLAIAALIAAGTVACGAPQPLFGSADLTGSVTTSRASLGSCVADGVCAEILASGDAFAECRSSGGTPRRTSCARDGVLAACAAEHATLFTYRADRVADARTECGRHAGSFSTPTP